MLTGKLTLALACSFAAAVAIPSALADGNASKQRLFFETGFDCAQGAISGTQIPNSFVAFKVVDKHVRAKISLQGAPANGEWRIELTQRPLEGCKLVAEGIITTNGHGNGNAKVTEPLEPGNTGAFVALVPLNTAAVPFGVIASKGTDFK